MEFIYNKITLVKAPRMLFHQTADRQRLHSYMNVNNVVKFSTFKQYYHYGKYIFKGAQISLCHQEGMGLLFKNKQKIYRESTSTYVWFLKA